VSQARALDSMAAGFDADGYKILCKPIFTNAVEIVVL
jgi:excinuclease Cho